MSALAALGLAADADERAVKRAYAIRLRSVRPDEDPQGFQALNTLYKAALAEVQRRGQNHIEQEEVHPDLFGPSADEEQAGGRPATDADEGRQAAPGGTFDLPVAPRDDPFEYGATRDDGRLEFDFDEFSAALFAAATNPATDLGAWLQTRMSTWPLALKPALAPYVLNALDDETLLIPPDRLAIIMGAFGLDDVLSQIDPLAVQQLRSRIEARWRQHESHRRAVRLLTRANLEDLVQTMRPVGYWPPVTRMLAHFITSRRARLWAVLLLWVPRVASSMMIMLRTLSDGAVERLVPPLDARAVAWWRISERILGKIRRGHVVIAIVALFFIIGWLAGPPDDEGAATDQQTLAQIYAEQDAAPEKAVVDYTAFINAHPVSSAGTDREDLAIAFQNRGVILRSLGRTEEAALSFFDVYNLFFSDKDNGIRLQVAKALVNLAYDRNQAADYNAAISYADKVILGYGGANDDALGDDSFDLTVAMALNNKADAYVGLGDVDAAVMTCRDVYKRFGDAKSDAMRQAVAYTREIERRSHPAPLTVFPPLTAPGGATPLGQGLGPPSGAPVPPGSP